MRVSIIIPVFDVEAYVEQCLRSVAEQTYTGSIECIVVDDCGTDGSMDVVSRFIGSYDGPVEFKVIHHEKNRGLSAARNTGMDEAHGEWIYFLDSDDYLTEDCIRIMMGAVESHPGVEMVHGQVLSIPYRRYYDKKGLKEIDVLSGNDEVRNHFLDLSINATDKLISSAFIRDHSLRFREGIIHEDELWSYYLYRALTFVAFVHVNTYVHLIRENSIMTSLTIKKDSDNWAIILTELSQIIEDPCYSPLEKYYLTCTSRYYDKSARWVSIASSFCKKLLSHGHLQSIFAFRRLIQTKDTYYRNWIYDLQPRNSLVSGGSLMKHEILKFFHTPTES